MKRTLRVLPEAEAEPQSAATWYEEKRPGLGVEFVAVVDRAFESTLEACTAEAPAQHFATGAARLSSKGI